MQGVGAIFLDQLHKLPLAHVQGRDLRPHIAQHFFRHAHIGFEQREDGLIGLATRKQLQRWDAQALLVDFGVVTGIATADAATDVRLMGDDTGKCP